MCNSSFFGCGHWQQAQTNHTWRKLGLARVRSRGDPTHAGLWGFIRAATLECALNESCLSPFVPCRLLWAFSFIRHAFYHNSAYMRAHVQRVGLYIDKVSGNPGLAR
eukprot:666046-Amphidinium_carterae.2